MLFRIAWKTDLETTESDISTASQGSLNQLGFREYGEECLRKAIAKMLSISESVRERSDEEAVHDMRVASRRLRAAISVFQPAFAGRRYDRFRKHVKQLTDALSRARDLDVMIGSLDKLADEIPQAERTGLLAYRDHLSDLRNVLQAEVRKSLKELEFADLAGEFEAILTAMDVESDTEIIEPVPANLEEEFAFAIHARIRDLRGWERYIADPRRVYELHQMRIAAKRLRYTMELFEPFRGKEFAAAIEQVRRVQEVLGKIHDADVIAPALLVRLRGNLKRVEELDARGIYSVEVQDQVGLLSAADLKRREREEQYRRFLALWRKIQDLRLLDKVLMMTQNSAQTSEMDRRGGMGGQYGQEQQGP